MAATKGVVGTVPQSVREDLVGRQFGSAVLDAPEPKIRDVDDDDKFVRMDDFSPILKKSEVTPGLLHNGLPNES